jgi:predicted TIM-barrel fold metal-dependent hydrolase
VSVPKGPVAPGGRLVRLLDEYENMYCDISAGSGHNALSRSPEFGRQFIIDYRSRLMYGTDMYDSRHLELLRSFDLPEDVFDDVTRRNAERLLGLE